MEEGEGEEGQLPLETSKNLFSKEPSPEHVLHQLAGVLVWEDVLALIHGRSTLFTGAAAGVWCAALRPNLNVQQRRISLLCNSSHSIVQMYLE